MARSASGKRKAPLHNLQRRVRARKEEPEPEDILSEEESSDDQDLPGQDSEGGSDEEDVDDSEPSSEEEEDEDEDDPAIDASRVSFGALAKAQASLPNVRKKKKMNGRYDDDDEDGSDDSDNSDEDPPAQDFAKPQTKTKKQARVAGRANKHAPAEQSSKRPVTRRREVVSVARVAARDPRFDALVQRGPPADEDRARRAYAFLDEYRDSEMARLKEAARAAAARRGDGAPREREREELKRALASMQSRRQAQQRRDEEKALLAEHRRREKELVRQGRKSAPFYLKRSEQRKQLLVDRFAGMKKKQVDRTIERRRKKLAAKERRGMPMARRERA